MKAEKKSLNKSHPHRHNFCGKIIWAPKPTDFLKFMKESYNILKRDQYSTNRVCTNINKMKNYSSSFIALVWMQSFFVQQLVRNSHYHVGTSSIMYCVMASSKAYGQLFSLFIHCLCTKKLQLHTDAAQRLDEMKH